MNENLQFTVEKENARFERTLRILIRKKHLGSGTTKKKMDINKDI